MSRALSRRDLWPFTTPPPLAWQRPSSPAQSVNEVEDPGVKVVDCVEVDLLAGSGLCGECHRRLCCTIGIVCGLPVVGGNFLENGSPWGTGWCCCGRVLAPPFQPSFRSIEYINCTLPATADVIEWEWLVIFHVVYTVICVPSPISLCCPLKCICMGIYSWLVFIHSVCPYKKLYPPKSSKHYILSN